jgi:hypothetical protein
MIKLSNILLEGINVYSIEALIKTTAGENKVEIYNQVRALSGIIVVTVEHSDFLDAKATDNYEYSLFLHLFELLISELVTVKLSEV